MNSFARLAVRATLITAIALSATGCDSLKTMFHHEDAKKQEEPKVKITSPLLAKGTVKHVGDKGFILEDLETDTYLFVDIIDEDKALLKKIKIGDLVKVYGKEIVKKTKDGGKSISSDIDFIELEKGEVYKMAE